MIANKKSIAKAQNKLNSSVCTPPKMYKSFNIFTQYGENIVVTSDRPMTIEDAQNKYNALSISGND